MPHFLSLNMTVQKSVHIYRCIAVGAFPFENATALKREKRESEKSRNRRPFSHFSISAASLAAQIFIGSNFHGKGVTPYPLPVQCSYATQSTIDLPLMESEAATATGGSGDHLWSTWDGRGYGGPAPRRNARPGVHSTQLKLDLFKDAKMTRKIVFHYDRVQSGQKLYARLQPKDESELGERGERALTSGVQHVRLECSQVRARRPLLLGVPRVRREKS